MCEAVLSVERGRMHVGLLTVGVPVLTAHTALTVPGASVASLPDDAWLGVGLGSVRPLGLVLGLGVKVRVRVGVRVRSLLVGSRRGWPRLGVGLVGVGLVWVELGGAGHVEVGLDGCLLLRRARPGCTLPCTRSSTGYSAMGLSLPAKAQGLLSMGPGWGLTGLVYGLDAVVFLAPPPYCYSALLLLFFNWVPDRGAQTVSSLLQGFAILQFVAGVRYYLSAGTFPAGVRFLLSARTFPAGVRFLQRVRFYGGV